MLFQYVPADPETKSSSGFFGSEKRFRYALQGIGIHPMPCIGDCDPHPWLTGDRVNSVACPEVDDVAMTRSIEGVSDQIAENLSQLGRVAQDRLLIPVAPPCFHVIGCKAVFVYAGSSFEEGGELLIAGLRRLAMKPQRMRHHLRDSGKLFFGCRYEFHRLCIAAISSQEVEKVGHRLQGVVNLM